MIKIRKLAMFAFFCGAASMLVFHFGGCALETEQQVDDQVDVQTEAVIGPLCFNNGAPHQQVCVNRSSLYATALLNNPNQLTGWEDAPDRTCSHGHGIQNAYNTYNNAPPVWNGSSWTSPIGGTVPSGAQARYYAGSQNALDYSIYWYGAFRNVHVTRLNSSSTYYCVRVD